MPMTSKEMIKFLKQNGFVEIGQNGSHKKLVCEETGRAVIVPYHSRDLKKGNGEGNTQTGRAFVSSVYQILRRCQYG